MWPRACLEISSTKQALVPLCVSQSSKHTFHKIELLSLKSMESITPAIYRPSIPIPQWMTLPRPSHLGPDVLRMVLDEIPLDQIQVLSAMAVSDPSLERLVDNRVMAAIWRQMTWYVGDPCYGRPHPLNTPPRLLYNNPNHSSSLQRLRHVSICFGGVGKSRAVMGPLDNALEPPEWLERFRVLSEEAPDITFLMIYINKHLKNDRSMQPIDYITSLFWPSCLQAGQWLHLVHIHLTIDALIWGQIFQKSTLTSPADAFPALQEVFLYVSHWWTPERTSLAQDPSIKELWHPLSQMFPFPRLLDITIIGCPTAVPALLRSIQHIHGKNPA